MYQSCTNLTYQLQHHYNNIHIIYFRFIDPWYSYSSLETPEKALVIAVSLFSLRIFEVAAEGTFFKPQVAGPWQVTPLILAMIYDPSDLALVTGP